MSILEEKFGGYRLERVRSRIRFCPQTKLHDPPQSPTFLT